MTRILAIDPSGNYQEGKGITGYCLYDTEHRTLDLFDENSKKFVTPEMYWYGHLQTIRNLSIDEVVMEGYKLYGHKAKQQINSNLETPQLIGIIKMFCYENSIHLAIQYASDVKKRWSNEILVHKGYLEQKGNKLYFNGLETLTHHRDALRHALHYWNYTRKKLMK